MSVHTLTRPIRNRTEIPTLQSDRYQLTGKILGQGFWGIVYEGTDHSSGEPEPIAIKFLDPNDIAAEQMNIRGIDRTQALRKEKGKLAACSNVVPRQLVTEGNQSFIVMPRYDQNLAQTLPNIQRTHRGRITPRVTTLLLDIVHGVGEVHEQHGRVHADIKPDNIMLDAKGRALLTDLGTSTLPYGSPNVSRDNMGEITTRAPECFTKGSHPTTASDVWSSGALAYEILTGKSLLGTEIGNAVSPGKFMENGELVSTLVKTRIGDVPRPFRKVLKKALAYDPKDRYQDGIELESAMKHAVHTYENSSLRSRVLQGIAAVATLGTLAGIGYLAHSTNVAKLEKDKSYLSQRVNALDSSIDSRRKREVVRAYLREETFSSVDAAMAAGRLRGYEDLLGDKKSAALAYLVGPEVVFRALEENGGAADYNSLKSVIKPKLRTPWAVFDHIDGDYLDSWMTRDQWDVREKTKKEWAKLGDIRKYNVPVNKPQE